MLIFYFYLWLNCIVCVYAVYTTVAGFCLLSVVIRYSVGKVGCKEEMVCGLGCVCVEFWNRLGFWGFDFAKKFYIGLYPLVDVSFICNPCFVMCIYNSFLMYPSFGPFFSICNTFTVFSVML
jgi:hypothetical protein